MIKARKLVEIGVPEQTVYARCRDGGPWQRLLPGILLLSSGTPTSEQMLTAALLHGGPTAMITGLHACRRHGVRRGPNPGPGVHLLVAHARHVHSCGFVTIERTHRLPATVIVDGFPMAPAPRACMDGARRLRAAAEITELLADAVQRGLCTVTELRDELAVCTRRGTSTPRRVLADVGAGVRSAAERRAKLVWARTGLPEPWWNAAIYDEHGGLLGVADCWLDDVALAWEIESTEWHLSPADHDRSVAKAARFVANGALLVPTKPRTLRVDEPGTIRTLQDAYRHARNRPRPRLTAVLCAGGRPSSRLT